MFLARFYKLPIANVSSLEASLSMNRVLSNISVKMGLTLVLAIFALLIIIIAFLGYQAGEEGSSSLREVDRGADQMRSVNRSQLAVANAQLFYINSFVAAYEGDVSSARNYLAQAQTFQEAAQNYFSKFESTNPQAALAEPLIAVFHSLMQQGLLPIEASLIAGDDAQFRTARAVSSDLNQQFIAASVAYNNYMAEQNK